jgi:hypothetical protein
MNWTNLPDERMSLRFYARRAWIEEIFGDFKKHVIQNYQVTSVQIQEKNYE